MKLVTMSSRTDFLTTIYLMNRQGESLGMKVRKLMTVKCVSRRF